MATEPVVASRPPRGSFTVWQRILRGYGPLAVLVVFVLLLAYLIPSKAQSDKLNASVSGGAGSDQLTAGDSGANAPGATVPGGTAAPGGQVAVPGKTKGVVSACTNRPDQVPGDPYSPACTTFTGDNGGGTSNGVTADKITVAYRVLDEKGFQQTLAALAGAELVDTPDTVTRTVVALADYFNARFQFYGRKLDIKTYRGQGSLTTELLGGGQDKANADARTVEGMHAFADLSAGSAPYSDALTQKKVLAFGDPYLSREWHVKRRPYAWSLATDCTILAEQVASYTLARLNPFKADYAGGSLKGTPRKIAGLAPDNSWYQECVTSLRNILKQHGTDLADAPQYKLDLSTLSSQAANIVPKLRNEGITTVICGCDPVMPVFLSGEANRQGYYPEFINIGVALDDTDIVGQLWNQKFASHSFGISALGDNADKPANTTIAYAAYKSVRPNDEPAFSVDLIYYQMYMLAIGVQQAGPNLNPLTFEQGMFDYPKKFGPTGLWGFAAGDYTPQDDVREIYYDPNATSNYNGKSGRWVDPNPGKRYPKGVFPPGPPTDPAAQP